jgi:hypothetical protein
MSGPSEREGSCERQNNKGLRRSYDSNFKLMVICESEKTNNCAAARKFSITENNVSDGGSRKMNYQTLIAQEWLFEGQKMGGSIKLMSVSLNS